MMAFQRAAGNASTLALLRRARKIGDEPPVTLTLGGLVDGVTVSSWNLERDTRGTAAGLALTRPIDAASPVLAQALFDGAPGIDGTLVVRRLTPLGWVRQLTVRMADCMVDQYAVHENYESARLIFSRVQVEQ
jgi:type VI protein secretion system component Hcp